MPMPFERMRTTDVVGALVGQEAGRLVLGDYTAEDAAAETAASGLAAEALDGALPSHVAIKQSA